MRTSLYRSIVFALLSPVICLPTAATEITFTDATIADLNLAIDAGTLSAEKLVRMSLARIENYDHSGPALNAVLQVNANALDQARALDRERLSTGRRSPLHGIPVVLKDNIDTAALPTTAGSFMLEGSMPPDDAFLVKRLKDAGAIILAKLNMSEFASGDAMSSLGGPTYNPHDLARSPSGSSGGTGVAIAAGYAMIGLGTDTGGSVRGPSSANGIVGLKPTHGLLSRDGIIPLALSFDTAGPMARSVYDIALALDVLAGADPADPATARSADQLPSTYTRFLDSTALDGARIGVARDFMGSDREVDWVIEAALQTLRDAGAEIIDITLPSWLLDARGRFYRAIRYREFRAQIADYLATTGPSYPKTLEALVERSMTLTAPRGDGVVPNPSRWKLMQAEVKSGELSDYEYVSVRDHALPLIRGIVGGLMEQNTLDAIVYPSSNVRPELIDRGPDTGGAPGSGSSPVIIANLTGFPDLVVPAGFTGRGLPVTLSFLGPAFSERKLLALGYAFEQRTHARRLPISTPPLAGETLSW
jgi:amidase